MKEITKDQMIAIISSFTTTIMERFDTFTATADSSNSDSNSRQASSGLSSYNNRQWPMYQWRHPKQDCEGFHLVPEDFDVPPICSKSFWLLWHLGNRDKNYPPYKLLKVSISMMYCIYMKESKYYVILCLAILL